MVDSGTVVFSKHLYLCQYSKSLRELREAMMILPDNFASSASSAILGKNGSSLYTSAPYLKIVKITFSLHCCLSIKDDNEIELPFRVHLITCTK